MMTEQSRPDRLVRDVARAEEAGFDFSVCTASGSGSGRARTSTSTSSASGDAVRHARGRRGIDFLRPRRRGHVEAIKPFLDAGFDEVALVQIRADQQDEFIGWAQRELLPALRSLN